MHLLNCISVWFCSNTQKVSRFWHYQVSLLCQFGAVKCMQNWGNFCLYWCDTNASFCQGVFPQGIPACFASHGHKNPWVLDPRMRLSYILPLEWGTERGQEWVWHLMFYPGMAKTSLGKDFMLCFHSSSPNCIAGKMSPKPNKCEAN